MKRWTAMLAVLSALALGMCGTVPGAAAGERTDSPAIGDAPADPGDLAQAPVAKRYNQDGAAGGSMGNGPIELPKALQGLSIHGTVFISYMVMKQGDAKSNRFDLKRGYFDVQKTLTPYLAARYTTDITRLGSGDWETRIKYLYGKFTFDAGSFLTQPGVEFGQGHVPYHDFWEAVNGYRLEGTMFLERNDVVNSADVGAVFFSNFGGEMSSGYQKDVDGHYAGRYGSTQIGVYNGAGYHGKEANDNKPVEARVTVRPLPGQAPGLQVGLFGVDGKANVAPIAGMIPDWRIADLMLSYQSRNFTVTGEGYAGKGNLGGSAVYADGRSRDQNGYSVFAKVKLPQHEAWGAMARYDHFDSDIHSADNDEPDRMIGGVSYTMKGGNMWLVDVDHVKHSLDAIPDETTGELALQMSY